MRTSAPFDTLMASLEDTLRYAIALLLTATSLASPPLAQTSPGAKALDSCPAALTSARRFLFLEVQGKTLPPSHAWEAFASKPFPKQIERWIVMRDAKLHGCSGRGKKLVVKTDFQLVAVIDPHGNEGHPKLLEVATPPRSQTRDLELRDEGGTWKVSADALRRPHMGIAATIAACETAISECAKSDKRAGCEKDIREIIEKLKAARRPRAH